MISHESRFAYFERVLPILRKSLDNPTIVNNKQTLYEFTWMLNNILRLEREHQFIESDNIKETITNNLFYPIITAIDRDPSFLEIETINFLGVSGKKEAVTVLFTKITALIDQSTDQHTQIDHIGRALRELYPTHHKIINKQIRDLIRSDSIVLRKIGNLLRSYVPI